MGPGSPVFCGAGPCGLSRAGKAAGCSLRERRLVTTTAPSTPARGQDQLAQTLQPRHLSMIALGGAIGAGLLVASSTAIATAGPGVIITYLLAACLLVLIMRMLGQMAALNPQTGSFAVYARQYLGPWAGFSVGWLYWWFWSVTSAIEATAAAQIINSWVPSWPQWLIALALMLLFTGLNLVSVRSFGEAEFWFSSLKVGALTAVIILGLLALGGLWPASGASVSLLFSQGGFLPQGPGAVFSALLAVIFSMFGAEIATLAAGESYQPRQAVAQAVRSVIFRVLFFYCGSIAVTLMVVPWTAMSPGVSPFVTLLEALKIPYAGLAMNLVVLSALLSCLNASLYASSRMVFALADQGDAPASLRELSGRRAPQKAILLTAAVGFAATALNYFMPDQVFTLLVNSTGAIGIFVWMMIVASHLASRAEARAAGVDRQISLPGGPALNYGLLLGLLLLLVFMAFDPAHRLEVLLSVTVAGLLVAWGLLRQLRNPLQKAYS